MSETKELIERLHDCCLPVCTDAAATIARLESERDAARREAMEECALLLDAEHEQRKQWDNHAAYYANMIRAAMQGEP
jgi:8-oxo-dGTP pyrophosphatase MutT (NUDIX family)